MVKRTYEVVAEITVTVAEVTLSVEGDPTDRLFKLHMISALKKKIDQEFTLGPGFEGREGYRQRVKIDRVLSWIDITDEGKDHA